MSAQESATCFTCGNQRPAKDVCPTCDRVPTLNPPAPVTEPQGFGDRETVTPTTAEEYAAGMVLHASQTTVAQPSTPAPAEPPQRDTPWRLAETVGQTWHYTDAQGCYRGCTFTKVDAERIFAAVNGEAERTADSLQGERNGPDEITVLKRTITSLDARLKEMERLTKERDEARDTATAILRQIGPVIDKMNGMIGFNFARTGQQYAGPFFDRDGFEKLVASWPSPEGRAR